MFLISVRSVNLWPLKVSPFRGDFKVSMWYRVVNSNLMAVFRLPMLSHHRSSEWFSGEGGSTQQVGLGRPSAVSRSDQIRITGISSGSKNNKEGE